MTFRILVNENSIQFIRIWGYGQVSKWFLNFRDTAGHCLIEKVFWFFHRSFSKAKNGHIVPRKIISRHGLRARKCHFSNLKIIDWETSFSKIILVTIYAINNIIIYIVTINIFIYGFYNKFSTFRLEMYFLITFDKFSTFRLEIYFFHYLW